MLFRQFSIFFIVYCVLVFAIGIQNINESYGEVKAYRGRISVALAQQPKSSEIGRASCRERVW